MTFRILRVLSFGLSCLALTLAAGGCKPKQAGAPDPVPAPEAKAEEKAPSPKPADAEKPESPTAPPPPDPIVLEGKEAFRSCADCHCTTDPDIAEDEDWIRLNEKTTCISGENTERTREAIIAYLRHEGTLRPLLVDEKRGPGKKKAVGEITLPATAGSAYLKAERDSVRTGTPLMVRLAWPASPEGKTLAVPAGEYRVINYWLYRKGEGGGRWMATVTNVDGCAWLTLAADRAEVFSSEAVLFGRFLVERTEAGVFSFTFTLFDENENRMTLSKNGRIVHPEFRIVDAAGKEVARGAFGNT
jgi:hypothetical protein